MTGLWKEESGELSDIAEALLGGGVGENECYYTGV